MEKRTVTSKVYSPSAPDSLSRWPTLNDSILYLSPNASNQLLTSNSNSSGSTWSRGGKMFKKPLAAGLLPIDLLLRAATSAFHGAIAEVVACYCFTGGRAARVAGGRAKPARTVAPPQNSPGLSTVGEGVTAPRWTVHLWLPSLKCWTSQTATVGLCPCRCFLHGIGNATQNPWRMSGSSQSQSTCARVARQPRRWCSIRRMGPTPSHPVRSRIRRKTAATRREIGPGESSCPASWIA